MLLFDMFSPRIIPHAGIDKKNPNKDYSHTTPILAAHAEIARPEYDYKWNSDGLRSVELSTRPPIIALGCSITLGQGLPYDMAWPQLLTGLYGLPVASIAYSGASANKVISSFLGLFTNTNTSLRWLLLTLLTLKDYILSTQMVTVCKNGSLIIVQK